MAEEITYWNADTLADYANDTQNVNIGGNYFKIVKLKASIIDGLDNASGF